MVEATATVKTEGKQLAALDFQQAAVAGDLFGMSEALGQGASINDVPRNASLPERTKLFLAQRTNSL